MKIDYEEIQSYHNNGLLSTMVVKLNLKLEDILDTLFETIGAIEEELASREVIFDEYEDQDEEIAELRLELEMMESKLEEKNS